MESSDFKKFVRDHKGVITGCAAGFLVGALILWIGFLSTLFLALCVGIGAFFGSNNKYRKKLFEVLDRILPDIFK